MFNKKMETMNRKEIRKLQLSRLKETVKLVNNVPFYKKKFKELNDCQACMLIKIIFAIFFFKAL